MKIYLIALYFVFSLQTAFGQDLTVEDQYDEWFGKKAAFQLAIRNQMHPKDYVLGIEAGIASSDRKLFLFGSFDARPYRKRVLEYQGGNQFFQHTEERYYLGAGISYWHPIKKSNNGVFAEINPSFTWGRYGGVNRKPENGWIGMPKAGFFWKFSNQGFIQAGYSYLDSKYENEEKHRLFLTFGGVLAR